MPEHWTKLSKGKKVANKKSIVFSVHNSQLQERNKGGQNAHKRGQGMGSEAGKWDGNGSVHSGPFSALTSHVPLIWVLPETQSYGFLINFSWRRKDVWARFLILSHNSRMAALGQWFGFGYTLDPNSSLPLSSSLFLSLFLCTLASPCCCSSADKAWRMPCTPASLVGEEQSVRKHFRYEKP